jgi:hypothetical protein
MLLFEHMMNSTRRIERDWLTMPQTARQRQTKRREMFGAEGKPQALTTQNDEDPVFLDNEGPSEVVPQGIYVTVRDE